MAERTTAFTSGLAKLVGETAGEGAPLVFLHAGVADRRMWRAQVDACEEYLDRYRGIAYDRRGFGESMHAEEPYSHVADLVAVLDQSTGEVPAILVGCSQGGRVAIDTALAHPARVRALVLVAPAISGAPGVASFAPAIQRWIDSVERAEAAADIDLVNVLEAHAWLDGPLAPEGRVGGEVRELFLAMNELALRAEQRGVEVEPPPAYARLEEVTVPTLVVCGDLDFPHVIERCDELARRIANARSVRIQNAAHLPNLEHPERFNEALMRFLDEMAQ